MMQRTQKNRQVRSMKTIRKILITGAAAMTLLLAGCAGDFYAFDPYGGAYYGGHDISVILTGQVGITEGITAAVDIMVAVVMAVVVMAVVVMAVVVMVVGVVMAAGFTSNGDTTRSTARL